MPRMTSAEFLAYETRRASVCDGAGVATAGCEVEADLHSEIIEECKRRMWIAWHGAMSKATSRTLGEADFTILADKGRVYFIECKTKVGKLSPQQAGMIHWANRNGHTIHVVRSMEDFLKVVST